MTHTHPVSEDSFYRFVISKINDSEFDLRFSNVIKIKEKILQMTKFSAT